MQVVFSLDASTGDVDELALARTGAVGWAQGEIWLPDAQGALTLERQSAAESPAAHRFNAASRGFRLAAHDGLPGDATVRRSAVLYTALEDEPRYRRLAAASASGFGAAVAVPVWHDGAVEFVLALHAERATAPAAVTAALARLSTQLGGALTRRRRRAAQASSAASSSSLAQGVFDAYPLPILILSEDDDVILDANRAAQRTYGIDAAALGTLRKDAIVAPDDLMRYRAAQDARGRRVRHGRHRTSDGRVHDVMVTSEPTVHAGRAARIAVVSDTSELRTAERALAESATRFQLVLDHIQDGVVLQDREGRIMVWNPSAERILGLSGDQLQGKSSVDPHWAAIRDDGSPYPGEVHPAMVALREGRDVSGLMGVRRGPGDLAWLDVHAAPVIDEQGAVVASVTTFTDITQPRAAAQALSASEARFRLLAEAMHDLVCTHDAEGSWTYVSPSSMGVLGVPAAALVGRSPLELVHPDDARTLQRFVRDATVDADVTRAPVVYRARHASGDWLWLESTATVVRDADGAVQALVTSSRDVTARRALEEQLRHAAKMEAVGTLAGGIAHDFNNLLTVIAESSHELHELVGRTDPAVGVEIDAITDAWTRARSLTRQLLSFARRNVQQVRTQPLDAVVRRVQPLLERLLAAGQALEVHCGADGALVTADFAELELAIMNLLSNARAAMPDGGTVTLTTRVIAPGDDTRAGTAGTWVELTVRDTGVGMSSAVQQRLFEPFFTTRPLGEGTGLGLATVYGVVTRAGGSIEVDSAPGAGSVFTIRLPAVPLDDAAAPDASGNALTQDGLRAGARADAVAADAAARRARAAATVLVVDDEPMVLAMTARVLRRAGYPVHEASSGAEALGWLEAHHATTALVVSDFAMPRMHGRALLEEVRRRWPRIAGLLVTGYADDETSRRASEQAGTPVLAKPYDADGLVHAAASALRRRGDAAAGV
ncbi:MAG: PAS domain S-box protein [Gemmatimonadaceae bacterium]|nr:PAS domain S-box protein [Gemmatimonadaceae bacterium]